LWYILIVAKCYKKIILREVFSEMKRKVLSALLSVAMVATLLVGCGTAKTEEAVAETPAAEEAAPEATPAE